MDEGAFTIALDASPLAPGRSPVPIQCRQAGGGAPFVFLHGGWGYEAYPFARQIAALGDRYRILIPDRTGYGGSGRVDSLPIDFHRRAAIETLAVVAAWQAGAAGAPAHRRDEAGWSRGAPVVLWGHSDGAVIALLAALAAPERVAAVVAEATHLRRCKPASREFFERVAREPERIGERLAATFARDHGPDWPQVIRTNGDVWLRLADGSPTPDADLYGGALSSLRVPTLIVHGARDPRTEPGELERLRTLLGATPTGGPDAPGRHRIAIFDEGGHSPHSEPAVADHVAETVVSFLENLAHPVNLVNPVNPEK